MSNSLIVIPIDQQGMADYETDISKRDNLKEFDFPKNEVEFLFDKGIVDVLNDTFGIWIDEYEEEIIKNEFLKETEKITANAIIVNTETQAVMGTIELKKVSHSPYFTAPRPELRVAEAFSCVGEAIGKKLSKLK